MHYFSLLDNYKIPQVCAKDLANCAHRRHQAFAQEARKRATQWMADPAQDPLAHLQMVPAEFQVVPYDEGGGEEEASEEF